MSTLEKPKEAFGLCVPLQPPIATPSFVSRVAQLAEQLGFASVWVGEHVVAFDEAESEYEVEPGGEATLELPDEVHDVAELEPFSSLAYMAARTETIRLGTGVCILPQRNPVYAAKEAANVDWLSSGRLELGIGLGWSAEEYAVVGASYQRRGARFESYVRVMQHLWQGQAKAFADEFYELPACRFSPVPVQLPHPPLTLGGNTDATFRRVAEFGSSWYSLGLEPEVLARRLARLREVCEAAGRDYDELVIRVNPWPLSTDRDLAAAYFELGVDEIIVMETPKSEQELEAAVTAIAERHL